MKKNNKGFMLIEAIVSGTIVLTSMIVLYSIFNKLHTKYNEKNNYYNIDAVYATKETINYLMKNDFEKNINNIFENSNNFVLIGDNECQLKNKTKEDIEINLENINTNFCEKIQLLYGVKNMIIAEYDKTTLENLKNLTGVGNVDLNEIYNKDGILTTLEFNQALKDYIEYVIGYYEVSDNDTRFSYIVITELEDGNKHYFANLGIE